MMSVSSPAASHRDNVASDLDISDLELIGDDTASRRNRSTIVIERDEAEVQADFQVKEEDTKKLIHHDESNHDQNHHQNGSSLLEAPSNYKRNKRRRTSAFSASSGRDGEEKKNGSSSAAENKRRSTVPIGDDNDDVNHDLRQDDDGNYGTRERGRSPRSGNRNRRNNVPAARASPRQVGGAGPQQGRGVDNRTTTIGKINNPNKQTRKGKKKKRLNQKQRRERRMQQEAAEKQKEKEEKEPRRGGRSDQSAGRSDPSDSGSDESKSAVAPSQHIGQKDKNVNSRDRPTVPPVQEKNSTDNKDKNSSKPANNNSSRVNKRPRPKTSEEEELDEEQKKKNRAARAATAADYARELQERKERGGGAAGTNKNGQIGNKSNDRDIFTQKQHNITQPKISVESSVESLSSSESSSSSSSSSDSEQKQTQKPTNNNANTTRVEGNKRPPASGAAARNKPEDVPPPDRPTIPKMALVSRVDRSPPSAKEVDEAGGRSRRQNVQEPEMKRPGNHDKSLHLRPSEIKKNAGNATSTRQHPPVFNLEVGELKSGKVVTAALEAIVNVKKDGQQAGRSADHGENKEQNRNDRVKTSAQASSSTSSSSSSSSSSGGSSSSSSSSSNKKNDVENKKHRSPNQTSAARVPLGEDKSRKIPNRDRREDPKRTTGGKNGDHDDQHSTSTRPFGRGLVPLPHIKGEEVAVTNTAVRKRDTNEQEQSAGARRKSSDLIFSTAQGAMKVSGAAPAPVELHDWKNKPKRFSNTALVPLPPKKKEVSRTGLDQERRGQHGADHVEKKQTSPAASPVRRRGSSSRISPIASSQRKNARKVDEAALVEPPSNQQKRNDVGNIGKEPVLVAAAAVDDLDFQNANNDPHEKSASRSGLATQHIKSKGIQNQKQKGGGKNNSSSAPSAVTKQSVVLLESPRWQAMTSNGESGIVLPAQINQSKHNKQPADKKNTNVVVLLPKNKSAAGGNENRAPAENTEKMQTKATHLRERSSRREDVDETAVAAPSAVVFNNVVLTRNSKTSKSNDSGVVQLPLARLFNKSGPSPSSKSKDPDEAKHQHTVDLKTAGQPPPMSKSKKKRLRKQLQKQKSKEVEAGNNGKQKIEAATVLLVAAAQAPSEVNKKAVLVPSKKYQQDRTIEANEEPVILQMKRPSFSINRSNSLNASSTTSTSTPIVTDPMLATIYEKSQTQRRTGRICKYWPAEQYGWIESPKLAKFWGGDAFFRVSENPLLGDVFGSENTSGSKEGSFVSFDKVEWNSFNDPEVFGAKFLREGDCGYFAS
ncbi:unnamed protein product [Amoebophrya sp. A120]|nr:unnamed protein product [Amoebophrya sp. A120]|eukprot:GSA120T00007238001.1